MECDTDRSAENLATELVVIDWESGTNALYPREYFEALDLASFKTPEGQTLADQAELFKALVIERITRTYCEAGGPAVRILSPDQLGEFEANYVYLTQAVSPADAYQIGEGEYDPCNRQDDNVAVIFGEQIRRLGGDATFDEWVAMFANVTAHEIGHMLGFTHIPRAEWTQRDRSLYVELMLDGHTVSELQREQRFVEDQSNCPGTLPRWRRNPDPLVSCSVLDEAER